MCDSNPVSEEVAAFDRRKLKKTDTQEKNIKPSQQDIDEEKAAMQQGK